MSLGTDFWTWGAFDHSVLAAVGMEILGHLHAWIGQKGHLWVCTTYVCIIVLSHFQKHITKRIIPNSIHLSITECEQCINFLYDAF